MRLSLSSDPRPSRLFSTTRIVLPLFAALILCGCPRPLERRLASSEEKTRQAALRVLEKLKPDGRTRLLPALIGILKDVDPASRGGIIEALSRMGADAVPFLIHALKNEDPRVRAGCAEALGLLGPDAKGAVPALVQAQDDPDQDVQMWAVVSLGRIRATMSETELSLFQLMYGKGKVEEAPKPNAPKAVEISAAMKDDIQALIQLLRRPDVRTRYRAIISLMEKGPTAVPSLVQALTEKDMDIQSGAAEVLRYMTQTEKDALPFMIKLMKDSDPEVRAASSKAFAGLNLSSKSSVRGLVDILKSPELCLRLEAIQALGALGTQAKIALPALKECVNDPNPLVRQAVLKSLHRIDDLPPPANRLELETTLNGRWSEMLGVLGENKIDQAMEYFTESKRDSYKTTFTSIGDRLPELAKGLSGDFKFKDAYGGRFVTLYGKVNIEGVEQGVQVQFVMDRDGIWRIRFF